MKVKLITKRRVWDKFFKIDEFQLSYEKFSGTMTAPITRLVFERGDAVAAVLFNIETCRLIFTRQFRAPTYEKGPGWLTEIIAGVIDPGEQPETAIRREVFEETGYRLGDVRALSTFYLSPGGSSERIFLYYAEVDTAAQASENRGLDEGEDIQLVEMTVLEALADIAAGRFLDAKTIAGILTVKEDLLRRSPGEPDAGALHAS